MGYRNIYSVFDTGQAWRVVKMDRDFEYEGEYRVTKIRPDEPRHRMVCTCYAGTKVTCRHRMLVDIFLIAEKVDSREAYDFDKEKWIQPPKAALEMM